MLHRISFSPNIVISFILGALLFGTNIGFGFSEPTQSPPLNNTPTPVNIGSSGQSKAGGLVLNTGGAVNGLIVQSGRVGIGTANPSQALDVAGYIKGQSGLCIGNDCRSSWPGITSESDPTVPGYIKDGVNGSELNGPISLSNSNFGGLFTVASANNGGTGNYCSAPNPYTNGCNCPGGFNQYFLMQLVGARDFYYPLDYRQQIYQCLR